MRYVHAPLRGKVHAEPLRVTRLADVVELASELSRELLRQPDHIERCRACRPSARAGREVADDLEIPLDELHDPGLPHLHDDLRAVVKYRRVCLSHRARRQWLWVELGERRGDA